MGTHENFDTEYAEHIAAALDRLLPVQGPAVDADLCQCLHDRGSHWDGRINCGNCDCHTFRARVMRPRTMPEHGTYMGTRAVRGATPDQGGPLYFARCRCGWEGPSRLNRTVAVEDGFGHLAGAES